MLTMKKELSVELSFANRVKIAVSQMGEGLSNLYSAVMEEHFSVSQSWKILNASLALVSLVFLPFSLLPRLAMLGWFLYALRECKRAGLK